MGNVNEEFNNDWEKDLCCASSIYEGLGFIINELSEYNKYENQIAITSNNKTELVDNISLTRDALNTYILIRVTTTTLNQIEMKIVIENNSNGIRVNRSKMVRSDNVQKYEYVYMILKHDNKTNEFTEHIILRQVPKVSINHKEYIKSEEWDIKRKTKLKEANYKCQLCAENQTELHVHHNNYDNLGYEDMSDLIVLCKDCHSKFHDKL